MCELADGTGEPNPQGIEYYNNLIDALIDKGLIQKRDWLRLRDGTGFCCCLMFSAFNLAKESNRSQHSITGIYHRRLKMHTEAF